MQLVLDSVCRALTSTVPSKEAGRSDVDDFVKHHIGSAIAIFLASPPPSPTLLLISHPDTQ